MAQLFSERSSIDAARYCSYNGFLGLILLAGAFASRLSGPDDPLGMGGFALVVSSAVALIAAFVVPSARPRTVSAMLAIHGIVIGVLTAGFAWACARWALNAPRTTFRYLPGLMALGTTYGAALWADFGPARARRRRWRVAGFMMGLVLELVVGILLMRALFVE